MAAADPVPFAGGLAPGEAPSRRPFHVTLYSLANHRPLRTFCFLGDVPRNVLQAARRGRPAADLRDPRRPARWPHTQWPAADQALLQRHYGKGWYELLVPDVSFLLPVAETAKTGGDEDGDDEDSGSEDVAGGGEDVTGGDENALDFGDLSGLNRLDEDGAVILTQSELAKKDTAAAAEAAEAATAYTDAGTPSTEYLDRAVFAADSLDDLAKKVYAATGIPPFRQHLFWEQDAQCETLFVTTLNSARVRIDVRRLGFAESLRVADLPVDREFADFADQGDIFVEARDHFRQVGELAQVFLADYEELVAPRRRALAAAAEDRLQSDLLYKGLTLKYWPKLDPTAARQYFAGVPFAEGGLAVSRARVKAEYDLQQKILYDTFAAQAAVHKRYYNARALAVTSAQVSVAGQIGTAVDVRNAFDLFATGPAWPAVAGRFYLSAGRSRQDATAIKCHTSAALGGNDDAADIRRTVDRVLRRDSLLVVIRARIPPPAAGDAGAGAGGATGPAATGDAGATGPAATGLVPAAGGARWLKGRADLVVFTLQASGSYTLEAAWPEDRRLSPAAAVAALHATVSPLLEAFNAMGALVFKGGGRLQPPKGRARIQAMTVAFFWPRSLTETGFRELKQRWRRYEEAGMATVRGLQQVGSFDFRLTKGVVDYDPRAIERTVVVTTVRDAQGRSRTVRELAEATNNTYAHLTDPGVAQRWDALYSGRLVKLYHRTSDIRAEFVGVTGAEFRFLWYLVAAFLDGLVHGPTRLAQGVVDSRAGASAKKERDGGLRAIRAFDPELIDLRKHDAKAKVYSVLCQNPRPPRPFTPEEAKALPARRRERLTAYWNFTENRPAFYECGHPAYPHLSFIEGRHPKGYCLPCCQKTPAHPGSRRDRINRGCLRQARGAEAPGPAGPGAGAGAGDGDGDGEEVTDAVGRHRLAFGKTITPGRYGALSPFYTEQLLYETLEEGEEYQLVGVPQSLPAIPQAGFFFALAAACVGRATPDAWPAFARRLVQAAQKMATAYRTLADGWVAAHFDSAGALANALRDTFIPGRTPTLFTAFSPGGPAAGLWAPVVEELAFLAYQAGVVRVHDRDGKNPKLLASARCLNELRNCVRAPIAVVFEVAGGTFPLAVHRGGAAQEAEARRFVFAGDAGGGVLREALLATPKDDKWDLGALQAVLKKVKGYAATHKLVNKRNVCYGVLLEGSRGRVYVPVAVSHHSSHDAVSRGHPACVMVYGPRPALPLPPAALEGWLAACRKALPVPFAAARALRHAGKYIGCEADFGGARLRLYHDPAARPLAAVAQGEAGPPLDLAVAPEAADAALWAGADPPPRPHPEAYAAALYRLFLAQFVAGVLESRAEAARARLVAALTPSLCGCSNVAQVVRSGLEEALGRPPTLSDRSKAEACVLSARARSHRKAGRAAALAELARDTRFDFDAEVLDEVRAAPAAAAAARVRAFMEPRVRLVEPAEVAAALGQAAAGGGMYAACAAWPAGQAAPACDGRRLLVPADRFEDLVSLTTAAVRNPLQAPRLLDQNAGVYDDLHFTKRPAESIEIRL